MNLPTRIALWVLPAFISLALTSSRSAAQAAAEQFPAPQSSFGYSDFSAEARLEEKFMAVPDPKLAGEELRTLTLEPHLAATPEDRKTADYVASKFRAAGLETEIVPYRVLLNWPKVERVEAWDDTGHLLMTGPTREHVEGDPAADNPRVVMPFNGSSGSGDVTAQVVYANYGRIEDFNELAARNIDLHGKIVICRYGSNFRGVKVYLAQQRGAVGVLLYSDPQDDGYAKGDAWPVGPWRPETGVQRGSVQFLFKFPGDPETPGVASTLDLPDSARIPNPSGPEGSQPDIISIPIGYHDAAPILQALTGPSVPPGWQGALPFHYHMGPGGEKVHLVSQQDYQRRIIWDVIGKIEGAQDPDARVIVGNHRDAWVYGAVDPSSGTAAMLEAAHGLGALLHEGWRPRRTIVFCSWDAEEEGLIGSTEWVEQQGRILDHAVAYFNVDVAVSGPNFNASAVPSLKDFVRNVARTVPSPLGGSVYRSWRLKPSADNDQESNAPPMPGPLPGPLPGKEVRVGDLGSGSDYTPFLQHAGVPSTDIESTGPYGVYHSAFDDFAWFTQNADPHFFYLQQMARVLGIEAIRMADADLLPYDYVAYAREISLYIEAAKRRASDAGLDSLNFAAAQAAAARFSAAAQRAYAIETTPSSVPSGGLARLNLALRQTETALLSDAGLPHRPWYRHTIFAPGELTGYAAVVLPGVNEAIDSQAIGTQAISAPDRNLAAQQLQVLTQALNRAAGVLETVR